MRILVTGVSGFVGAHLVRELAAAGHLVWGTDRTGRAMEGLQEGRTIAADLLNRAEVRELVRHSQPDAVIHLAAQSNPSASWDEPGETLQVNAGATATLAVEAGLFHSSMTFLLVSSSDVYGRGVPTPEGFTEGSALRPLTPYAVSKIAAEQTATLLAARAGMRLIIARPFSHTGPGQTDRFVVPAFARQIAMIEAGLASELLHGDLEPCRDFTDVRDVVRAYRLLVESPRAECVFNIGSGNPVSIQSILRTLCSMADCEVSCRPDPARLRGEGPNPVHGSAQRLQKVTGWRPEIALSKTLADVLAEQRLAVRAGAPAS